MELQAINIFLASVSCMLFFVSPVRLTRFHQDLGWLSCLHSPTFRHLYIETRISQDFAASVRYVIPYMSSVLSSP